MKKNPKKTAGLQAEFSFCAPEVIRSLKGPPLEFRHVCVREIPEQRTVLQWVRIFADNPPGPHQFCRR
jgi:hypothetical protein